MIGAEKSDDYVEVTEEGDSESKITYKKEFSKRQADTGRKRN